MTQSEHILTPAFRHIESWVFDLDNTLYPARCNLFAQIDQRMGEFIASTLNLSYAASKNLQKQYYLDHGTTMNGLMTHHDIDPGTFMDYVHDIDLSPVEHDAQLDMVLAQLPGKKYVFTNASSDHAVNVMDRLGVARHFNDIFDIVAADYVPKPAHETYLAFLDKSAIAADKTMMFEDLSRNLEAPHKLGMTTVLITADNHPDADIMSPQNDGPHVHFTTDNLGEFLTSIIGQS